MAWLIHNGIPFDVAHALPPEEQKAYAIAFSQFHNRGQEYDWVRDQFIERR